MEHTTAAVTATAVLIGALAALTTWFVARRRTTTRVMLAVVAAGLVTVVTAVASLFVLVPRDLDAWGVVHLAYLLLTIAVPMVGITLVAVGLRVERMWLAVGIGAVLMVPAPLGAYATHVEPTWLRTDDVALDIDAARSGSDPIRIGVLSDIQTNDVSGYEQSAVDRLMATEPDIILIPGDLFQGTQEQVLRNRGEMGVMLRGLDAPGGVYFVQGDSDHYLELTSFLPATGIVPLFDEIVDVTVGDREIRIGGILNPDDYDYDDTNTVVRQLEDAPEDGTIRILMSHRPDVVNVLSDDSRIDLTVAGHTHGGQIVLPFAGPPVTLSDVPRSVARGGLHTMDGNPIVVSPGIGMVRGQAPQVRFLSRPAIVLVDLR
jgi:uncharacterized protein